MVVLTFGSFVVQVKAGATRASHHEQIRALHPARQEPDVQSVTSTTTPDTTATSLSVDLNHSAKSSWLSGGISFTDDDGSPFKLECKNCSTSGTLTLTQSDWDLLPFDDWFDQDHLLDIIQSGAVVLDIKSLSVHLELGMQPSLQGKKTLTLFSLPLFAFPLSPTVSPMCRAS
jgi:hypothetical protein